MRTAILLVAVLSSAVVRAQPAIESPPAPPLAIDLAVNQQTRADIFPGTPLTISAMLQNQPAAEARTRKVVLERMKASLAAAVAEKWMTQEESDAHLAGRKPPQDAPAITVRALRARLRFSGAEGAALPWEPRMLDEKDTAVVLDADKTLGVVFAVSPEQTATLKAGQLRLVLHYDGKGAFAGEWAGQATSNEVIVRVVERPAALTAEQTWTHALALSSYHLAIRDWDAAVKDAQTMVNAVPKAPAGHVQLARAREGKGDPKGALEAYEAAINRAVAQAPNGEPPFEIMREAHRLRKALGGQAKPAAP